jgi:acyl dehydratase
MPTSYATLAELAGHVGQHLGTSDWVEVDQARIDAFAAATGDHQWIHVDAERAKAGPFGTTIAHGFLTLSLLPMLFDTGFGIANVKMGVNYGLNRVRFMSPVPAGSRLRAHFRLLAFEPLPTPPGAGLGAQLTVEASIEREGASKPACIADTISRRYT